MHIPRGLEAKILQYFVKKGSKTVKNAYFYHNCSKYCHLRGLMQQCVHPPSQRIYPHLRIRSRLCPLHLLGLDEVCKLPVAASTEFCSIHAMLSCKASCAKVLMFLPLACAGAASDNLIYLGLAGHSTRQLLSHAGLPAWACRPPLQDDILWQPDRN